MAVNVITNLFSGGTRAGNSTYAMLPSANSGTLVAPGFADHQRRRSYQVVRQMRFTPRVPYGGLGNFAYTDQKDWEWYEGVIAAGNNVAVDDVWNMIMIPANTRLEYIAVQVFTACTDFEFEVQQVNASGVQIGTDDIVVNADSVSGPTLKLITAGDQSSASIRYVGIHVTATLAANTNARLKGLDFAVQAEVVDWGSYDLNGNA